MDRNALVALACFAALSASGCLHLARLPGLDAESEAPATPDRLWKPPAAPVGSTEDHLPPVDRALPERAASARDQPYDLGELVGLALSRNPETRKAWEEARASAAEVGRATAPYYPTLRVSGQWDRQRYEERTSQQAATIHQDYSTPSVALTWTLIDFGRRKSGLEAARQQLVATGLTFNRKVQEVVFRTQAGFFLYDAARARVTAAEQNLALAQIVRTAVEDRRDVGLATEPAALLARQTEAEAAYELEDARAKVSDTRASLAVALGVPANLDLEVVSLADEPLPHDLDLEVDALIDSAVAQRPDLAARVAEVRARAAQVEQRKADLYPEIGFNGRYGVDLSNFSFNGLPSERIDSPIYNAGFGMRWDLFTGFERLNAIRQAEADTAAARSELANAELEAIAAVWRAYYDFRAAQKKLRFAEALLRASQDAYDSNVETYRTGLSTITELLRAETDLARARYTAIDSRAQLLISSATIAYATGAIDPGASPGR